jgi:hypothetical protein
MELQNSNRSGRRRQHSADLHLLLRGAYFCFEGITAVGPERESSQLMGMDGGYKGYFTPQADWTVMG